MYGSVKMFTVRERTKVQKNICSCGLSSKSCVYC